LFKVSSKRLKGYTKSKIDLDLEKEKNGQWFLSPLTRIQADKLRIKEKLCNIYVQIEGKKDPLTLTYVEREFKTLDMKMLLEKIKKTGGENEDVLYGVKEGQSFLIVDMKRRVEGSFPSFLLKKPED